MKIPDGRQAAAIFAFNRGGAQTEYDASDIAAARRIEPLLHHVIRHGRSIAQLQVRSGSDAHTDAGWGHLIVDPRRRVLQMNAAADTLLRRHAAILFMSGGRSEEHTSELQSLMRISYAVFCLKKKKHTTIILPL